MHAPTPRWDDGPEQRVSPPHDDWSAWLSGETLDLSRFDNLFIASRIVDAMICKEDGAKK